MFYIKWMMVHETVSIYSLENDWLIRKSTKTKNIKGSGSYTIGDEEIELVSNTDLSLFN